MNFDYSNLDRRVETTFGELAVGDTFIRMMHLQESEPPIYMRIAPFDGRPAVSLNSGMTKEVHPDEQVLRVQCDVTVEREKNLSLPKTWPSWVDSNWAPTIMTHRQMQAQQDALNRKASRLVDNTPVTYSEQGRAFLRIFRESNETKKVEVTLQDDFEVVIVNPHAKNDHTKKWLVRAAALSKATEYGTIELIPLSSKETHYARGVQLQRKGIHLRSISDSHDVPNKSKVQTR